MDELIKLMANAKKFLKALTEYMEDGAPWAERYEVLLHVAKKQDCLDDLQELVSWFEEEEE